MHKETCTVNVKPSIISHPLLLQLQLQQLQLQLQLQLQQLQLQLQHTIFLFDRVTGSILDPKLGVSCDPGVAEMAEGSKKDLLNFLLVHFQMLEQKI